MVFTQIAQFTGDLAGLERLLRMFQALCQLASLYALSALEAQRWARPRDQLAFGRRYFRVFKFIDSFQAAYDAFVASGGLLAVLGVAHHSCMAMHLLLEVPVLVDGMGLYPVATASRWQLEADRFWFYALLLALATSTIQLTRLYLQPEAASPPTGPAEKPSEEDPAAGPADVAALAHALAYQRAVRGLVTQLVVDGCDVLIPGATTGLLRLEPVTVAAAMVVSTVLTGRGVWVRVVWGEGGREGGGEGEERMRAEEVFGS